MGSVGHGRAVKVRSGAEWKGTERKGGARQEWLGLSRSGTVGRDWAWQEWHGEDRRGSVWLGRFGNHYKTKRSWIWYLI